jgi:hypothetical protein
MWPRVFGTRTCSSGAPTLLPRHERMRVLDAEAIGSTTSARRFAPMTRRGEIEKLARLARAQGWRVEQLANGHYRFVPPDPSKPMTVTGGTPSDKHFIRNLVANLRRLGLKLPR